MNLAVFILFTLCLVVFGVLAFLVAHSTITGWYPGCGKSFWES